MRARDLALLAVLFALAFGLRFYDVATPAEQWGDELVHVPAATHYWTRGHFDPNLWEHPPLRHLLLKGFLAVFGDGPYGWRMRNVLLGALASVLVALFAYGIDRSRTTAAVAGLLLATDPLHVALSRFTFEEIYGVTFFLGALVTFQRSRARAGWLLASGLLMGCALATKWYYVPVWILLGALALREEGRWRRPADALLVATAYVAVPLTVYALSYGPWFGRGYSLGELAELTVNAYHSLQQFQPWMFNPVYPYLRLTSPLDWFVAPVMFATETVTGPDTARFLLFGNNLAVWGLTLPALITCAVVAVRRRSPGLALPVLLFVATYTVPLVARRPTLIYSTIPLLPFAFTAIGMATTLVAERLVRRAGWAVAALLVGSNLYLYPLAAGRDVPVALYAPLLSRVDVTVR